MNSVMNRRRWMRDVAAAATVLPFASTSEVLMADQSPRNVPVIDTHLHCFAGADSEAFPYHERAPYRPQEKASPEHLLHCMDGAGVDHAIVVHPEPYQDDHRYLEHCLEVGGGRLKGTCLFFADRPESLAAMPGFLSRHEGSVVAARIHAYAPGRLPPFGSPELRRYWQIAAEAGVAIQLHFEPRYADELTPYIEEFSETTVIIDHLGRPMQGTPEEHAVVIGWARYPNTVMKLSSLPRQDRYPHRDVGPIVRRLTDAWGAERMIYGGGFSAGATRDSYRAYRQRLRDHLGHLSDAERAKIFGGTAARLFGFAV